MSMPNPAGVLSPADELLSESEARELANRILALSDAEGTSVAITSSWTGNTRSAVNRITTAGEVRDTSVSVTARFGNRVASSSTNRLDDDAKWRRRPAANGGDRRHSGSSATSGCPRRVRAGIPLAHGLRHARPGHRSVGARCGGRSTPASCPSTGPTRAAPRSTDRCTHGKACRHGELRGVGRPASRCGSDT